MAKVLIVDDDQSICKVLSNIIHQMGHDVVCKNLVSDGLQAIVSEDFDVVLMDVEMPDGKGLDILPDIQASSSAPEVIIMTGYGTIDGAEIAIKNGAWDYIQKTDSPKKIILLLQRVLQYRENLRKIPPDKRALQLDGIVGDSLAMKACYDFVAQASATNGSVLITGETGTGKELFARAIHNNSNRCKGNFVVVDCAAMPETLVESILFGHEKGAFTGADQPRQGLVAQADQGTLFLDEVGELPLNMQKKFLRVLQEHKFRPVGSKKEHSSDFRLITATNRDLEQMGQNKTFRTDLMYRIRALNLTLPPLRNRSDDIPALINQYVFQVCDRQKLAIKGTSSDFIDVLVRYFWPGNVRELINTIETAVAKSENEEMLYSRHIPANIRIQVAKDSLSESPIAKCKKTITIQGDLSLPSLKLYRAIESSRAEKEYLEKLNNLTGGDIHAACRVSKLSRSRYYELIKHHEIAIA